MQRVLIIDDDEVITNVLYKRLIESGIPADLAVDPAVGDALLSMNAYAVVLMDAYLTGQLNNRALDLLDRVRHQHPDAHIVLLTAYESRALADRVRQNGNITVMPKPQPVAHLAELITSFLAEPKGLPT